MVELKPYEMRRRDCKVKKSCYLDPSIRNILVLHLGQVPVIALLVFPPFPFIGTSLAPCISLFALHFTQYPSVVLAICE